jgi:hypothetical protein
VKRAPPPPTSVRSWNGGNALTRDKALSSLAKRLVQRSASMAHMKASTTAALEAGPFLTSSACACFVSDRFLVVVLACSVQGDIMSSGIQQARFCATAACQPQAGTCRSGHLNQPT